ncbi:MAG: type II secretion system F family protein [Bryobacteraceae bacterium]|jgi:tight adherence protein C
MAVALSIAVFLLLTIAISAYGYRLYAKPARIQARLGAALEPTLESAAAPKRGFLVSIAQSIGEKVPISPGDAGLARRYLIAAGFRSDRAVKAYYGAKFLGAAIGFAAAIALRTQIDNPVLSVLVLPAGAAAGFFFPNFILERLVGRRQERIRLALPDVLDLMVVCMEAGLGLDQALTNVSRELLRTYPDVSQELALVNLEMRAGKRRVDALKNLADRADEPELRKLVATLIQADRFGTSLAEALRTHADFMRVRRRQDAEERAGKVGVKLVFPIFFFILPAMLVVAAGPGLLQLFKNLFPMMRGFQ